MDDPLAGDNTDNSTAAPAPIDPTPTPSTGDIAAPAAQPSGQAAPAAVNQVLPSSNTGLRGVLDSVLNFLSSRPTSQITYDDQGKHVTPAAPSTTGQNARNVAATALTGAARAAAAPPGPGHVMQGAAQATLGASADVAKNLQDQDANAQQVYDAAQKAKLNAINYQLGIRKVAESDLTLKAMGVKATEDQIDFADRQIDREKALGSYDLGMVKDAGEIADVIAKLPNWQKQLYAHEGIQPHPAYGENGTRLGLQLYMRKPDVDSQPAPEGTKVEKFNPPTKPGDAPTTTTFTPVGASNADIDKYKRAYLTDSQAWQLKEANAAHLKSETDQANANVTKAPSEIAKNNAEAAQARASAAKSSAEAAQLNGTNMDDSTIVNGMLNNTVDIRTIESLRKDRRDKLVAEAMQKQPGWNEKKYETAMDTVKEFNGSGKAAQAIQSFQRFVGHADLLSRTADELRNTNSPLLNKSINSIKSSALGSTAKADVKPVMDAAANEHMSFMLNGRAQHSEDVKSRDASLNDSMTPAQMQGALKSMMRVQLTQLGKMNQRYMNAVGRPAENMIDDQTRQVIQANGLEGFAKKELGAAYDPNTATTVPPAASTPAAALPPPATHHFSPSAWLASHPGQDVQAATAQAKAQGYTVGQ